MSWAEAAAKAKEESKSGGAWLRLADDGATVNVMFLDQDGPRKITVMKKPYMSEGPAKPTTRYVCQVLDLDNNEVRVWEFGQAILEEIADSLAPHIAELGKSCFKITRRGVARSKTTRYRISFVRTADKVDLENYDYALSHRRDIDALYNPDTRDFG